MHHACRARRRARTIVPVAALVVAAASLNAASLGAQDSLASAPRTSADSTFTDAQAERGAQLFTRQCLECHAREDMRNPDFKGKWSGQSTFDLFKNISTTMPDNNPGLLAVGEYVDVVAYILKINGVPAGSAELTADSTVMRSARLNFPAAAPGGAFVQRLPRAPHVAPGIAPRACLAMAHARPAATAR
ncbi:MAG: cytochrome c [Gemmatimonadaceae bacterium]|nr:cytochrome c [Gemmatimonadaceae bacterium]